MELIDRRQILNTFGHSKPKKNQSKENCLHYLAKSYKLIIGKLKKKDLIDKIIKYEINNSIIISNTNVVVQNNNQNQNTNVVVQNNNQNQNPNVVVQNNNSNQNPNLVVQNNNQNQNPNLVVHKLKYSQRKKQLELLNFKKPKKNHLTCIYEIAKNYKIKYISNMCKRTVITLILKYELINKIIINNNIRVTNGINEFKYHDKWLFEICLHNPNEVYDPKKLYFPEHLKYEYRYIDFVKHLSNLIKLNMDTKYLYHISQLREDEIVWINNYSQHNGYEINIDINWVNENDDFSTQYYVNEKYKVKDSNSALIDKIEDIVYDSNKFECSSCTICMCEFEEKEVIKKVNCNHMFHSECIKQWILREPKCPCCRVQIN